LDIPLEPHSDNDPPTTENQLPEDYIDPRPSEEVSENPNHQDGASPETEHNSDHIELQKDLKEEDVNNDTIHN